MNEHQREEAQLVSVVLWIMFGLGLLWCLGLAVSEENPIPTVLVLGSLLVWRLFWLAGQKGEAK